MTTTTGWPPSVDPYAERVDHGPFRFLYRLNPLSKIAGPLPAMALVVFTRNIPIPLAFAGLGMLLLLVGAKLRWRQAIGLFVAAPALTALMALSFALWTDPALVADTDVLVRIGDYRFFEGALAVGLATSLRLASLLLLALVAGLTTTGPDLVRAAIQQLRVPYRVGYTALAAYRFVPRFGQELDLIRQAHRVRGVSGGHGPLAGIRRYLGYAVPLLAGAIRHAERVALAMDARAFGAHAERTERHLVPFRARDWAFIVLFWAATALIVTVVPVASA